MKLSRFDDVRDLTGPVLKPRVVAHRVVRTDHVSCLTCGQEAWLDGFTISEFDSAKSLTAAIIDQARKTFAISDWTHVCRTTSVRLAAAGARESAVWAETAATKTKPTKSDQDQLDACICLVSACHLAKGRDALFVGCCATGHIIVPDSKMLRHELERRSVELGRETTSWVRVFRLSAGGAATVLDAPHAPDAGNG